MLTRTAITALVLFTISMFSGRLLAATAPMGEPPVGGLPHAAVKLCLSDEARDARLSADPELAQRLDAQETQLQQILAGSDGKSPLAPRSTSSNFFVLPIVVHVVHAPGTPVGTAENLSYDQIRSQIEALNRDFRNVLSLPPPAVDTQIEFCLASNPPSGSSWYNPSEPGVTRTPDLALTDHDWPAEESGLKALDYFPSSQYLNVWIVRGINHNGNTGVVGYGTFPGSVAPTLDGIVMNASYFGANNVSFGPVFNTLPPGYDEGKIMVHEVGHFLDLFHTFHGGCDPTGCVSSGDRVCDTPAIAYNHSDCPSTTPDSCPSQPGADQLENFMDYTNDVCRDLFTAGQAARMQAAILAFRPQLVDPSNLVAVGCSSGSIPTIAADRTQVCTGDAVTFTTATNAISYEWDFAGGSPSSVTSSAPVAQVVTYAAPGAWDVSLTTTDSSFNTNSLTKPQMVFVFDCAPIASTQGNWYFGTYAGLNFASGNPQFDLNGQNDATEAAATQSDAAGNLLFYTDGVTVWNAQHQPMETGLLGNKSAHRGALIVPVPGSTTKYFVFTVPGQEQGATWPDPLRYSVVDMTLNGLLGGIAPSQKNLIASLPGGTNNIGEAITAVPHCNGSDWWVITQSKSWPGPGTFFVNLVNSSGATTIAQDYPGIACPTPNGAGTFAVSPDGSLLADVMYPGCLRLLSFDRQTGAITPYPGWPTLSDRLWAASFSPDSNLLYSFSQTANAIIQTRISTLEERIVGEAPTRFYWNMQLGPDQKIYAVANSFSDLSVINYPNLFNTKNANECGFNIGGTSLGGRRASSGLPNMIDARPGTAPASFSFTAENCLTVRFATSACGTAYQWDFGDGSPISTQQSPTHTYPAPGDYNVTLTVTRGSGTSSVTQPVNLTVPAPPIFGPRNACAPLANYSTTTQPEFSYQWTVSGGTPASATTPSIDVSWGPSGGAVNLVVTDTTTGCSSPVSLLGVGPCFDAVVTGRKYRDQDRNCQQNVGEAGLRGWAIAVGNSSNVTQTSVTDANGDYSSSIDTAGTYSVHEVGRPGWVQICPPGGSYTVNATSSGEIPRLYFGNYECPPEPPRNSCVPPPTDMVAWWPMDEFVAGGLPCPPVLDGRGFTRDIVRAKDDEVFGHPSDPGCGPSLAGQVGGAMLFGDQIAHIEAANQPALNFGSSPGGDFSIDAWIETTGTVGYLTIVDKRQGVVSGPPLQGYSFFVYQGRLWVQLASGGAFINRDSGVSVANGAWHHVAVTVDRDNPAGGRFYVDGVLAPNIFDPTVIGGSLVNSQPLRIGRRSDGMAESFRGMIDELEIFRRALTAQEVAALYNAGHDGKCKRATCHLRPEMLFRRGTSSLVTGATLCNRTGSTQTFQWSLAPLPGTGPNTDCPTDGPTSFQPAAGTMTLNAGRCQTVPLTIGRPAGTGAGLAACYQLTAVGDDGQCLTCQGRIGSPREIPGPWPRPHVVHRPPFVSLTPVPLAGGYQATFDVTNEAEKALALDYRFAVRPYEPTSAPPVVSLNGLPPGTPVPGTIVLAPGETGTIGVGVTYSAHDPFTTYDLVVEADTDGDGTWEVLASQGLQSAEDDSAATPCDGSAPSDAIDLRFAAPERLEWNPLRACDGVFHVYRGTGPGLANTDGDGFADDYGRCFASSLTEPAVFDDSYPPLQYLYWYLVTAENPAGEGSLGTNSAGAGRPRRQACP